MWNLWQSDFVRSLILDRALLPAVVTMLIVVAASKPPCSGDRTRPIFSVFRSSQSFLIKFC